MQLNHRSTAYALLRVTVGSVFLIYGTNKFLHGVTHFAANQQKGFADTFLPSFAAYAFGLLLPFLEVTIGSLLILGFLTRIALILAGLVILVLTAGLTILGESDVVAQNLIYAIVLFLLLYYSDENAYCLDKKAR